MSKFTAGLNDEQRQAVVSTEGPLLVLAGAGTGKTRVITHRIAHMLAHGVSAQSVLAMTFTNRAAGEMKARIGGLVSRGQSEALTVGTFHAFCVRALRQFGERVGLRRSFGICDADDQLVAMKQAMRELQIAETEIQPRVCLSRVSLLKNRLVGPAALLDSGDAWEQNIGRAYQRYDAGLRASGLLDFDDLLLQMVALLQDSKTLAQFRARYRYLCVDEYQDTNGPQYEIVRQIGGAHRNVCVVGDDDQSIYGWRGADVSKILNFEKDFPGATVVRLETNYRSTVEILQGANAVIRNNASRHAKTLRSAAGSGEAILVRRLRDEADEAKFVVADILSRVQDRHIPIGEFAILFRTAIQPRVFELELRHHGVPYHLVGGMSFFDRKEVRDVLAYLRLVANPGDELALLRVINTPPRGIGGATVEKMLAVAAAQRLSMADVIASDAAVATLPSGAVTAARRFLETLGGLRHLQAAKDLVALVKQVVQAVGYPEEIRRCYPDAATQAKRWEAVTEIMNMAEAQARHRPDTTLMSFLEDVALNAQDEREQDDEAGKDRLTLMTLHSAKGLEFGEVYLVGMEEGLLPHQKSIEDRGVEEERRLAYVGITRARRRLTVSYVESRARYGQRSAVQPSRFLYEMLGKPVPAALVEPVGAAVATRAPPAAAAKAAANSPAKSKAKKRRAKRAA